MTDRRTDKLAGWLAPLSNFRGHEPISAHLMMTAGQGGTPRFAGHIACSGLHKFFDRRTQKKKDSGTFSRTGLPA